MKASDIPMSEDKLLRDVIEMAATFGVHTAHFRPAQVRPGKWITPVQGDGKGWPDLFLIGAGGGFWRETKAEGEYLKPDQKRWFAWLREAGFDVDVWKPRDWHSGRIQEELRAISRPKQQEVA